MTLYSNAAAVRAGDTSTRPTSASLRSNASRIVAPTVAVEGPSRGAFGAGS